jgi:hypothetical protein
VGGWRGIKRGGFPLSLSPKICIFTHSLYPSPLILTSIQMKFAAENEDQLPKLPAACQGVLEHSLDLMTERSEGVVTLTEHAPV